MPFVSVRGIEIYYEIQGNGPRLLGVWGTGGDLRRSPNVLETPLVRRFKVLAYDQRGLGRSSRPDVPYTMADYAADADALLEAAGWDQCLVLGFSFGGMVAQEFALRHPNRVKRLVLASTSSGGAGGDSYPLHEIFDLPLEEQAGRIVALSDTRRDAAWRFQNQAEFKRLVDERLAQLRVGADEPGRREGARRQLEARAGHDAYDRLPGLKAPTYVCGGRYDGLAAPENQEAMHRRIPGSILEFFEGGHFFFFQDPHAFDRITTFLQQ